MNPKRYRVKTFSPIWKTIYKKVNTLAPTWNWSTWISITIVHLILLTYIYSSDLGTGPAPSPITVKYKIFSFDKKYILKKKKDVRPFWLGFGWAWWFEVWQMIDSFGTYNKQNNPMAIIYKSKGKGSGIFSFFLTMNLVCVSLTLYEWIETVF